MHPILSCLVSIVCPIMHILLLAVLLFLNTLSRLILAFTYTTFSLFVFSVQLTPLRNRIQAPPRDPYAPHPDAPFEGYYTRLQTPAGSTIVLIFSSVFKAPDKPHYIHFSLLRPSTPGHPGPGKGSLVGHWFPREIKDTLGTLWDDTSQEFTRSVEDEEATGVKEARMDVKRGGVAYRLLLATTEGDLEVTVDITSRTPWNPMHAFSSPEGVFSWLSFLPLHWHVHSTASNAKVRVVHAGKTLEEGAAIAHLEKNWGHQFPAGWVWSQAFSFPSKLAETNPRERLAPVATLALAGGKTLGSKAYLIGYRSEAHCLDYRPLWTILPFGYNLPWCTEAVDSKGGRFELSVKDIWNGTGLEISAKAPGEHEGWQRLCCPWKEGHANAGAWESFDAGITVRVLKRRRGQWVCVEERTFEGVLEFGGVYSHAVEERPKSGNVWEWASGFFEVG